MKGAHVFVQQRASSWYIIIRRNSWSRFSNDVPFQRNFQQRTLSLRASIFKTRASLEKTLRGQSTRRIPEGTTPMPMPDCNQPQNALTNLADSRRANEPRQLFSCPRHTSRTRAPYQIGNKFNVGHRAGVDDPAESPVARTVDS